MDRGRLRNWLREWLRYIGVMAVILAGMVAMGAGVVIFGEGGYAAGGGLIAAGVLWLLGWQAWTTTAL